MQISFKFPTLFLRIVEFMQTPHSLEFKSENAEFICGICWKSPLKMRSLNELPALWSSNEFPNFIFKSVESTWTAHSFCEECGVLMNSPLWLLKLWSLFWVPTLFLQNAESARTLHWVFEKCRVHMNSPLCGVYLNCCLVFKKCGVQMNSPLWF